jgi:hypothetical protein
LSARVRERRTTVKRVILTAAAAALLAAGCGGRSNSDPKPAAGVKEDTRLKRAGPGPAGGAAKQSHGQMQRPTGRAAE